MKKVAKKPKNIKKKPPQNRVKEIKRKEAKK